MDTKRMPETAGRQAIFPPLVYLVGGGVSAALGLLGMFVAYQILGSEAWIDAIGHGMNPARPLFDVSLIKALEVLFTVLGAHYILRAARIERHEPAIPVAFALAILAMAVTGYLTTYNNQPESGSQHYNAESSQDDNTGTVDRLLTSLSAPRDLHEASAALVPVSSPESPAPHTAAWFFFAGVIFVSVAFLAALYLQLAERCLRAARLNPRTVQASL